jgi:hypothetical protein
MLINEKQGRLLSGEKTLIEGKSTQNFAIINQLITK